MFASAEMFLGQWLLFAMAGLASGDALGPETWVTGELRKLQQIMETPPACAEACPSISAYMEDLETVNPLRGVERQTAMLNLWCNHSEALSCGFQATECLLVFASEVWVSLLGIS